jgi:hypothetical protein
MYNTIDRVAEWFQFTTSTSNEPFLLEDAVNIASESIRSFQKDFSVAMTPMSDSPTLVAGRLLPSLVDIFLILFDNIVKHSGLPDTFTGEVRIRYGEEGTEVSVVNSIDPGVAVRPLEGKLDAIKRLMREGAHLGAVAREGGTGFLKVYKILAHDLAIEPRLDMGLREDGKFFARFWLPKEVGMR